MSISSDAICAFLGVVIGFTLAIFPSLMARFEKKDQPPKIDVVKEAEDILKKK